MKHQIVIVGGGSGGVGLAASLVKRRPELDIAIIEPREEHYYQPGWTLVGGGAMSFDATRKPQASVIPKGVKWIRDEVKKLTPKKNSVTLKSGKEISYEFLALSPGLKLDWGAVKGLEKALGKDGVTSNYMPGMAKYTWELIEGLEGGKAIFTQPPMPIKCAGAPQKIMYLAADHWKRAGRLDGISVDFCNAGGVLFGVADYVPPLMEFVESYGITLNFERNLTAIDAKKKLASFSDGQTMEYDMIHVTPPQIGMDFVKGSGLEAAGNWIEVDQHSLQSTKFENVFGLGDATTTPNAKTAAAARKQIVVVAQNLISAIDGRELEAAYDGYGSCPLTVARGKIVLAEFAYGGKLTPTFPSWANNGLKATSRAWFLKKTMLPWVYWNQMLKGVEWFAGSDDLANYR